MFQFLLINDNGSAFLYVSYKYGEAAQKSDGKYLMVCDTPATDSSNGNVKATIHGQSILVMNNKTISEELSGDVLH